MTATGKEPAAMSDWPCATAHPHRRCNRSRLAIRKWRWASGGGGMRCRIRLQGVRHGQHTAAGREPEMQDPAGSARPGPRNAHAGGCEPATRVILAAGCRTVPPRWLGSRKTKSGIWPCAWSHCGSEHRLRLRCASPSGGTGRRAVGPHTAHGGQLSSAEGYFQHRFLAHPVLVEEYARVVALWP